MCKAWDDQEAQGKEIGKKIGKKIGKEIGAATTLLDNVSRLQENMSCSLEQALSLIGKTMLDYEKAKQLLEQE